MTLNILCCNPDGGAFYYITQAWGEAFKDLGHNFVRWDGSDAQVKKFKPHIYLGCSGWRQNFPAWARKEFGTKVGIHVNPWGKTVLKPLKGEPNINEPSQTIKWVELQKPDFVYCYGNDEDISHMWNKWTSIAPVVPMPNAGNAIAYHPVTPDPAFACDVGFVGGCWPYKSINLNKYLLPVIQSANAKIYGWGGWKHIGAKYKGPVKKESDVNKVFSSSKVCPSVVEPHTTRYGIDIPERMFKVPLGGGFTVCDPCKGLERYVDKNIFPIADNPNHYRDLILYYIKNDSKRIELQKKQRKAILENHTYHTRIQGFLNVSGFKEEALKAQERVKELVRLGQ